MALVLGPGLAPFDLGECCSVSIVQEATVLVAPEQLALAGLALAGLEKLEFESFAPEREWLVLAAAEAALVAELSVAGNKKNQLLPPSFYHKNP